ncbi:MAG: Nif3-like dinuclear metal center hexameric protein [Armatimonadetes bacterium]|nr:Nif3-like dinuclear metal center hexameric protein [Armatimonadota bacterium]
MEAGVASRKAIIRYLDEALDVKGTPDYGPQGLQVEGKEEVRRVATAVSSSRQLFEQAADWGADLIMVHHGLFWDRTPRTVLSVMRRRLGVLLAHDINLAAYHLCLDRHPEFGNNILAARGLGLENLEPFGEHNGVLIGYQGTLPDLSLADLAARVQAFFGREPLVFPYGADVIRTVGIITGGAQGDLSQAIDAGLDAFITGEVGEFVMHTAREGCIHYLAAGHYATETTGIRALGEHVAARFSVEARFFDLPNPA